MKLHIYDHCPFCVRARIPFGLKDIPVTLVAHLNDDEATPISMVGKKMLPILEDDAGFVGESGDIVIKVDGLGGAPLFDTAPTPAITDWLTRWTDTINALVIPRTPDPVYPEFRTEAAVAYFTKKKEAQFGRFEELRAETETWLSDLATAFEELVPILPRDDAPGMDDVLLFPQLRSLTVMPGLAMPESVAAYTRSMSARSGIPLVDELRAGSVPEVPLAAA